MKNFPSSRPETQTICWYGPLSLLARLTPIRLSSLFASLYGREALICPFNQVKHHFPLVTGFGNKVFFLTVLTSLCGLWLHVQTLVKMSFLISRPSEIRISFSIVFQSPWRARESRPKKKNRGIINVNMNCGRPLSANSCDFCVI